MHATIKRLVRNCSQSGTLNANIIYIAAKWNLTILEVVLGNVKIAQSVEESMLQRAGAILDFMDMSKLDNEPSLIFNYLCTN